MFMMSITTSGHSSKFPLHTLQSTISCNLSSQISTNANENVIHTQSSIKPHFL